MSRLEEYKGLRKEYVSPKNMHAVILSGVGEQNLKLTTVEIPECKDNQLLARVDAVNICASDNKLIDQGSQHALMYGWDTWKHPIIIGHEGSLTIVKVGRNLETKYNIGQRFAIQPAVPSGPYHYRERYRDNAKDIEKIAIGYTLPGLFAEYVLLSEEVIETGCLLPFQSERIAYFGAALAEPVSCVIAAQERIVHVLKEKPTGSRRAEIGPKQNGVTLIVGAGPMGLMHIEVAMSYHPKKILVSEVLEHRLYRAINMFHDKAKSLGISLICTHSDDLEDTIFRETEGKGVDDVIVALGVSRIQEKSFEYLARGGITNFFGGTAYNDRFIKVDTHRIHYDGISVVGSSGSDPSDVAKVLEMMDEGRIDPGRFVVKCGGLDAAISLIVAFRNNQIDGKGVIYPHARHSLLDIEDWSLEKEKEFLERNLIWP